MMTSPACAVTVPRPVCESSCWTSKEEHETSRDPREDARRLDKFTSVVGRASWSGSERCKQIAGAAAAAARRRRLRLGGGARSLARSPAKLLRGVPRPHRRRDDFPPSVDCDVAVRTARAIADRVGHPCRHG